MTYSEKKFRINIQKMLKDPNLYCKKIPDKKVTGLSANKGLPDYLIITKGKTYWFEIKQVVSKKYIPHTFNLDNISDNQWIEFTAMTNAGAEIFIAIYLNKELYIIPFESVQYAKFIGGEKSIHQDILVKWRIKWSQELLKQKGIM